MGPVARNANSSAGRQVLQSTDVNSQNSIPWMSQIDTNSSQRQGPGGDDGCFSSDISPFRGGRKVVGRQDSYTNEITPIKGKIDPNMA